MSTITIELTNESLLVADIGKLYFDADTVEEIEEIANKLADQLSSKVFMKVTWGELGQANYDGRIKENEYE